MIGLALEKCKELGINKVLMTCDKTNIGSAKSIINNGGVLESEFEEDGVVEQRYWITVGFNLNCEGVRCKGFARYASLAVEDEHLTR